MASALILVGLLVAGAVIAAGGLHWLGLIRFGQRSRTWGLTTIVLGLAQVVAWMLLPGEPTLWLRPGIALLGALVAGLLLTRRFRPRG